MIIHFESGFMQVSCGTTFQKICEDFDSFTDVKENVTCERCLKLLKEGE